MSVTFVSILRGVKLHPIFFSVYIQKDPRIKLSTENLETDGFKHGWNKKCNPSCSNLLNILFWWRSCAELVKDFKTVEHEKS